MAAENTDDDEKCPANSSSLSLSERNKLPTTCLIANNENDNHWAWVAGGVAALATGVALGVHNSDTDGNAHGNNYAPTPANDDGDDIVPPDDSSGDNDDVIPPDDGDDNVTPVDHTVKTFINSVTINKGAKSLLFDDIKLDNGKHLGGATLSYVEESDQWVLTTEGGKTLNVANWKVTDYNAAVLEGTQANGLYWKYDSRGYLILADENTTVITGDEEHATTRGMTISGEGKTGVIISGDHTINTLSGDSTATDGAVGLVITGDGSQNTIAGNSTVDGAIGALISGYDTVTNASGEITVTGGGTAMIIDGDNITLNNKGISDISGQGSTGSIINGNNAKIANDGKMNVSDGATGARITGNNATIDNNGNTTTRGEGSVALIVDGDNTTITNEGTQSISDGAMGSHVKGDDAASDSQIANNDALIGIDITGSNNQANITGVLNINMNDQSVAEAQYMGSTIGLNIKGKGNNINLMGGINIDYSSSPQEIAASDVIAINIDGDSNVTLNGHSQVNITDVEGGHTQLVNVQNGGSLVLSDSSIIDVDYNVIYTDVYTQNALLTASGEGSSIDNQGTINADTMMTFILATEGAQNKNSGKTTVVADGNAGQGAIMAANGAASTAENTASGDISLTLATTPAWTGGAEIYPMYWYSNTAYGMLAYNYGTVTNDANAHISVYGAGVYGMGASKGTALNAGNIYVDGFRQALDEDGNVSGESYWNPAQYTSYELTSAGMVTGSLVNDGSGDATAINTGTITVHNEGFGMTAMYGGTVINQGNITLTADSDTAGGANQLVGMAAFGSGVAINDINGVINIDAAFGQPFYSSGGGLIVNYGTICFDGVCQNSDDYDDRYLSLSFKDGGMIADAGETLADKNIVTDPIATDTAYVTNAGTLSGGKVTVNNYGDLTNKSTGNISSVDIATGGIYTNDGTTATVSVDGGIFNNTGAVTGKTGTTVAGSVINNSGTMKSVEQWASTMNNTGLVSAWTGASGNAVLNNNEGGEVDKLTFSAAATVNNAGVIKNGSVDKGGTLNNLEGGIITLGDNSLWSGAFNNWGTVNSDADIATSGSGHTLYNGATGVINGQITTSKNNGGSKAINDGAINIDKSNNVAMSAHGNAKMVNNGTINVGTKGTSQTNMVGMQLESDAKTDAVIENNGTINIYANNSYAFSQLGSNGHIVNNGTVYIDSSVSGSGFIKQDGKTIEGSGENGNGTETHYVDFTAPTVPTIDDGMAAANAAHSSSSSSDMNNLSGYVVGTNADGSAGELMVSNASMSGVEINTGFTAGTADTSVSFDNVVKGSNLTDADAIQSTSVVWTAQGSTDADGNVDVTMSKNAYVDVATDNSVSDVAQALDAGYTNNELYTSLNVGTTAELNNALKQVSGSQATTVFREARILSNRFTMLADAAPQIKEGLAFNVVAKGDPRAELGNDT